VNQNGKQSLPQPFGAFLWLTHPPPPNATENSEGKHQDGQKS
jgi:hypothetical protein